MNMGSILLKFDVNIPNKRNLDFYYGLGRFCHFSIFSKDRSMRPMSIGFVYFYWSIWSAMEIRLMA